jgi:hypothetical protein
MKKFVLSAFLLTAGLVSLTSVDVFAQKQITPVAVGGVPPAVTTSSVQFIQSTTNDLSSLGLTVLGHEWYVSKGNFMLVFIVRDNSNQISRFNAGRFTSQGEKLEF